VAATSATITVNPNIAVAWSGNPPTSALEGGSAALAATITNDVGGKGLSWTVSPSTCGSLSATTGTNVTYNAPSPLAAACTATVTVSSVADPTESVQTAIAVTPTTVSITAPTTAQSVASSAVVAFTATIANDGSGKGIVWTITPATGCGAISATAGAAINYTAPAEANLPVSCTATVSAAPMDDPTKTKSVQVTANPISVSAITSTSGTLPLTVGQGSVAIPLSATISYDTGGGITWGVSQSGTCGTWGTAVVNGTTSTLSFTPAASIAGTANCVATFTASSVADSTKSASTTITVTPLTVSITTPATNPTTVADGTTQALVAKVVGDAANNGVTWSLNPATGCGSLTIPAVLPTLTAIYNAPPALTPACTVTVTATSVTDTTKSTTTTLNATPGISVGLSPAGPLSIDANNPLPIMATVTGDSAGKGVNLSLNPATGCGSLSAASASSGVAFSYNPPSALASSCTVSVVAASQSDATKTATLGLTVYPALTLPATGTSSLGTATVGANYNGYLNASGGIGSGNYTWTVTGLSDGLTSNATSNTGSTVTISGIPTTAQTVTFQASVKDSTGTTVGPITYTITVNAYTLVQLPSTSLPSGTVNQAYNGAINAVGGIQSYTYTVNGTVVGASPTLLANGGGLYGANSGGNTLSLTGTPTAAGTITLNVSVVDGEGKSASQVYTVGVNPVSTIVITTSNLEIPQGMATMPYGTNFNNNNAVSGGSQPYSYSFTGLPSWASSDSFGNIWGTPTASGSTTVTVTVKDSSTPQQQQTGTFTLPVVAQSSGANNALLSGQYACLIHQTYDIPTIVNGHSLFRGAIALAIALDGNGNITGGEADSNTATGGYKNNVTNGNITGTYALGSDNRGYLAVSKGNGSYNYMALAAGTVYAGALTEFRLTEMDDVGSPTSTPSPSGRHGGGLCFKQYDKTGTSTLNGQALSGGYVFQQNGEDSGGNWETGVGSINVTGGSGTGIIDIASGSKVSLSQTYSGGTVSTADQWGRVTITCSTSCGSSVLYITNQSLGQGVFVTTDSHAAGNDLLFGQLRAQSATAIAASYPLTGPFVMYTSGLDNETGSTTKSMIDHGTGSSSAKTITIDGSAQNDGGTLTLNGTDVLNKPMAYTVDTTTGRVTFGQSGDVMYLYGTNEAVVMLADTGSGGASSYQNIVGWLETQVAPSSGPWALSNLAGNYFMGSMYTPGTSDDGQTGSFTLASSGSLSPFAQDDGGPDWADWDSSISGGGSGQTATGVVAPDTTLDPSGTLGIFDINITQGTSTSTQVYCFATNVNTATKSTTWGRLICMDATSHNPKITIVAQ
jgi:hypothetical protein